MANRNYQAGRRFEWRIRDVLRRDGWHVFRTAGSKGPVDLIAARREKEGPTVVWLVQCKNHPPTKAEREAATEFAKGIGSNRGGSYVTVWLVWPPERGRIDWECVS